MRLFGWWEHGALTSRSFAKGVDTCTRIDYSVHIGRAPTHREKENKMTETVTPKTLKSTLHNMPLPSHNIEVSTSNKRDNSDAIWIWVNDKKTAEQWSEAISDFAHIDELTEMWVITSKLVQTGTRWLLRAHVNWQ